VPKFIDHLNSNLLCVMDCETNGLDPDEHEMWQLCILPLDSNLEPSRKFPFFNILMKIDTSIIDYDIRVFSTNKQRIAQAQQVGFTQSEGAIQFLDWFDRLKLIPGKKIVPLGHNVKFDIGFVTRWLGQDAYEACFDYHVHDTFATIAYLNMQASFRNEPIPFPKWQLTGLASRLGISTEGAHDALIDCQITAKCYKQLMNHYQGLVFDDKCLKKLNELQHGVGAPEDLSPAMQEWIQNLVAPALNHE
jgi:DNA polymerase III alpha subunit (gram-positive type)